MVHHVIVRRWLLAGLAVLAVFGVRAAVHSAVASVGLVNDPPVLVPWSSIGYIALGESKTRVEHEYGLERDSPQGYYRLHGSKVFVTFEGGRVTDLNFTTPYYRTRSGFGVGSTIPLGPCHRTATHSCEHRWHGFVFDAWNRGSLCNCWTKVGLGAGSLPATTTNFLKPWFFIYTTRGRVIRFYFSLRFVD